MKGKIQYIVKQLGLFILGGTLAVVPIILATNANSQQNLEVLAESIGTVLQDTEKHVEEVSFVEEVEAETTEETYICEYEPAVMTKSLVPDTLSIPSKGITLPVVYVPLVDGTWEVHNNKANFAEGTSLVDGVSGNTGIFGHDRVGQFREVKSLRAGEIVYVYANEYRLTYQVSSGKTIQPENISVFYPTEKPTLTLVTCNGPSSEMRYALHADLQEVQLRKCYEK